jgi:hypothetical protein
MILRELFYFDKETVEPIEDYSYEPEYDDSPVEFSDTRKTKLSLRQINRARKASELHKKEQVKELDFVRQMYGIPSEPEV